MPPAGSRSHEREHTGSRRALNNEARIPVTFNGNRAPRGDGENWASNCTRFERSPAALARNLHQRCTTPRSRHGKTPDFSGVSMAVTVGFEPTVGGYPTQLFESCTFGRSDTSPRISLRHRGRARESAGHQAVATSAWARRMPSVEPAGARPMPHSVATPNSGANVTAAAIRRRAPSAPSSRCTRPR